MCGESEMKQSEKKTKKKKDESGGVEIGNSYQGSGGDVVIKTKSKEKKVDSDPGDGVEKSKKKKIKEAKFDSEADVKKSKKKRKKTKVDSEVVGDGTGKKKKDESGGDEIGNSENSEAYENSDGNQRDADRKTGKRKRDDCDLGAEENTEKSSKKKKKKKKASVDVEVEDTSFKSTGDAKKKKPSKDSEAKENNKDSTENAKKNSKEKKPSKDSEAKENNEDSTKDADKEKKKKKKKQSEDSLAEENDLNSRKDAKKKKQGDEDNKDSTKKGKKKEKCSKSDRDVNTPSSKSTKRVKFSDQMEVFPAEDELIRGKRFSKEEDALIKKAVLEYIDNHALGDDGLKMVLECRSHPLIRGCWKEIAMALPWRPQVSVYYRAHSVFEAGSKGVWTKEDFELVRKFHEKHGNDWKTLADAMGKHRVHVKDAYRRIRLNMKKGSWSREEYQTLFDLVNKEIRMKAYKEKHSKHGMLRDNIPWMAISDELGTKDHVYCCEKWYKQLTSPMVAEGTWANVDDYRLLEELMKLDAACIDDVDWDNLLENRDGDACRNRWNQMVRHIGTPGSKTFAEQVEILSERYCPDLAEDREDFDNRPFDPED